MGIHGVVCVDKPTDMTSFSCCALLRRLLGTKKVGHAGTLDPMATGVLPLLVGHATRALDWLPDHTKRYTATMRFGFTSDTLDAWGEVSPTGVAAPTAAAAEAALAAFRGEIWQIPPMTSAVKHNGERLYALARRGETVERAARAVTVSQLTLLQYDEATGVAHIDCTCSRGTYIRTLCDDWGRALGCGAIMTALRRTEAAGFSLADSYTVEQLRELADAGRLADRLLPVEQIFETYDALTVSPAQATRFQNGGALDFRRLTAVPTAVCRVYSPDGRFLGLGQPGDGELQVARLFAD